MFDNNPNHKNPFTHAKQITYVGGVTVTIPYKDGGWLNSGKEIWFKVLISCHFPVLMMKRK